MADYEFIYLNHGVPDIDYIGKNEEVFIWFKRPVTGDERLTIAESCPEPLAYLQWTDDFVVLTSVEEMYDFSIAYTYASDEDRGILDASLYEFDEDFQEKFWELLGDGAEKFWSDLEKWLTEVNKLVPILVFYGPNCASYDDPWAEWSADRISGDVLPIVDKYKEDNAYLFELDENENLTEAEYAEYEKENCVYSDTFSSRVLRPAEIQQHYRFIRGILGDFAK